MAILVDDPGTLVDDPDVTVNGATLTPDTPGYIPGIYNATTRRTLPTYELVLASRTPNQLTAATHTELGQILAPTITWSHVLNGDGELSCSAQVDRLDRDVADAITDMLDGTPLGLELVLYRNGTIVWRGPVAGGQVQSGTVTLDARGLPYLLRYMWITTDLTFDTVDEFTIAKTLVDHWQALDYGHFGIDTTSVGTSGTTRDRTYLAAENPNVREELARLADVGFDWHIDPATRALVLSSPQRGADNGVVFDRRNIGDPGLAFSVAAGDVASEGFGAGTSATDAPIRSVQSDTAVRQAFGRTGTAQTFDGVSEQDTLDDHTARMQAERSTALVVPGPKLTPVKDADVDDIAPGDTVTWEYDSGLGLQTFTRRLTEIQVSVTADGSETLKVAMA